METVQTNSTPLKRLNKEEVLKKKRFYWVGRRAQDIFFSGLALIVLSPYYVADSFDCSMPTFRKSDLADGISIRNDSKANYLYGLPLIHTEQGLNDLNEMLLKNKIDMIIKPHPHAARCGIENINCSNIIVWTSEFIRKNNINIYEFFLDTCGLVTDYSTVAYDYLLTNHPIAFVIDDYDDYTIGYAFDNMLDYMPGEKIKNLSDFDVFLNHISEGSDPFKKDRIKISKWANEYQDGNNAERFVKLFNL